MKAICYVLRNRLRAGWGDGTWLDLINHAASVSGNVESAGAIVDPADRLLQMMVRDIDDIYLGSSGDDTKSVVQDALYFQFIDKPPLAWFVDSIVKDPERHPRIGQVGPIALFK